MGGYMVKVHPSGRYELKKCVDNMHILRERTILLSTSDELRAVTRRMILDLECKGTLRGAVETFNLAVNLRESDSMFQECMRTFMAVNLPGSSFIYRLETELGADGTDCVSARIPPTRRPSERSKGSEAPVVDAYGFRGLDPRVAYLSPFEFFMYWKAEPLLPPYAQASSGHTMWLNDGEEYYKTQKYSPGFKLTPSVHYGVVEGREDYLTYPNIPQLPQ